MRGSFRGSRRIVNPERGHCSPVKCIENAWISSLLGAFPEERCISHGFLPDQKGMSYDLMLFSEAISPKVASETMYDNDA